MFSFFKSSKKSPAASPSNEKAEDHVQKNDDFVHIPNSNSNSNIYPSFPLPVIPQNPPAGSPSHHPFNRQFSVTINYTHAVPFKLNSALIADNSDETWNYKLREMNSILQRINTTDYDFKLERSIVESS